VGEGKRRGGGRGGREDHRGGGGGEASVKGRSRSAKRWRGRGNELHRGEGHVREG
jgi:hypothetical protein